MFLGKLEHGEIPKPTVHATDLSPFEFAHKFVFEAIDQVAIALVSMPCRRYERILCDNNIINAHTLDD